MSERVLAQLGLLTVAPAAIAAWLLAAVVLYVVRRPHEPPVGPHTLELGPEPPAVVNFLVHDFRVGREAVPATLLDLAARGVIEIEQRGPGAFYVRLKDRSEQSLTSYEDRVLRHLRERARDGVVPAKALTTGPQEASTRWRRGFTNAVVADAQRRGLSRDRLDNGLITALGAAALVPAGLVWRLVGGWEAGLLAFAGALSLLGWVKARHPQQETLSGLDAASRWLGVRAALAENEVFATRSPLEVVLWDRLLAYGAALGVAGGASEQLPMGAESDHRAWSAHSGRWREVRVRYPRFFPLGWGLQPHVAVLAGVGAAASGAAVLVLAAPILRDVAGWWRVLPGTFAALACAVIGGGVVLVATGVADFGSSRCVSGPILRLRALGSEKRRRYYVAVDDGSSSTVRAWSVDPLTYARLSQGDVVTVDLTRTLCSVRSVDVLPTAPVEPLRSPVSRP